MILILGSDGYIGTHYTHKTGFIGVDSLYKRTLMSALNIKPLFSVEANLTKKVDISKYGQIASLIAKYKPDAVVHLAENPSAPYSMRGHLEGAEVIDNNLHSTLSLIYAVRDYSPETHIIKLGTMGQYGCPNVKIPEGWFDCQIEGRTDRLLFPRTPHSIYHLSKAFDSDALAFACRVWGLKVTDLQQGFVHSLIPEAHARFSYDAEFGTVLNRFMIQAIAGHPLTVYGKGGQTRGVLHIQDTLQCLDLAIENTPKAGEYRVINQLTEWKSINDFADLVKKAGHLMGFDTVIDHIDNPRVEKEEHFYEVDHQTLKDYGLKPHLLTVDMICETMEYLAQFRENINTDYILPQVRWRC